MHYQPPLDEYPQIEEPQQNSVSNFYQNELQAALLDLSGKKKDKKEKTQENPNISVNYVDTQAWAPPGSSVIDERDVTNNFSSPDGMPDDSRISSVVAMDDDEGVANYNSKQTKSSSKKKKKLKKKKSKKQI